jgi:hypothetical protein
MSNSVICITTFNRIDCARINIEIIKYHYSEQWPIVHACSSENYTKHIEDVLVRCTPKKLQTGAFELLKTSILTAVDKYNPDFIIHLEADTWLFNQKLIEYYIVQLSKHPESLIASSSWSIDKSVKWKKSKNVQKKAAYFLALLTKAIGLKWHIGGRNTLSSQFFIIKNTIEFIDFFSTLEGPTGSELLEKYLYSNLIRKFGKKSIVWIKEREPVHPYHRDYCEAMDLYCQHYPSSEEIYSNEGVEVYLGKKEILQKYIKESQGAYINKLIKSKDTAYYNPGAKQF